VTFLISNLMLLIGSSTDLTFGHNFSSNESAVFLALVDTIKTEAQLVQKNLANNNVSMANEHANRALAFLTGDVNREIAERNQRLAGELNTTLTTLKTFTESASGNNTANDINLVVSDIDAILDEVVTARIDPEQLNNSTIQALRMVELLDKVLSNYGDAYAVGFDMTNMSMMMDGSSSDGMNSMSSMDMGSDNMSMGDTSTSDAMLINITDYQTAQVLAMKAQELFNSQLMNTSLAEGSGTADQSIDNIAAAIQELVTSIDRKASPMDIMMIVHTKVHPNLVTAFGLQLD
jgi:hypothetical protein